MTEASSKPNPTKASKSTVDPCEIRIVDWFGLLMVISGEIAGKTDSELKLYSVGLEGTAILTRSTGKYCT